MPSILLPLRKGKVWFLFVITDPTVVNTSTSDYEIKGTSTTQLKRKKKKTKARVSIKRVKSDSYFTYGHET